MTHAVIPAAGRGERMGSKTRKQFLALCGRPVIVHTLSIFQKSPFIDDILCVASKEDQPFLERLIAEHGLTKVKRILPGGERRQDSVQVAIEYLEREGRPDDIVLVHDGVRPLVPPELIERVAREAYKSGGAVAALPVTDSLKEVSADGIIEKSVAREKIWSMQTPQAFRLSLLIEACRKAAGDGFYGTDEAMLVERIGVPIRCIQGSSENIKITTPSDLKIAELLLSSRSASDRGADRVSS
ncbi:MAG TPA: 2-C-methyl-D-erythritol 4-phosphate cytidylyltransferase [Candidatus Manganitrophaceae bacterium]|nr:2-C-methyl-D-erythritol 4-phosphate cytidylyltransferase [Candidatus Manganitrophaceae bacterium]